MKEHNRKQSQLTRDDEQLQKKQQQHKDYVQEFSLEQWPALGEAQ